MSDELKEHLLMEVRLLDYRYKDTGNERYLRMAAELQALIERECDE